MTKENETESEELTLSKVLAEIEEISGKISPEKKEELEERLTLVIGQKSFKGPLPPPAILKSHKDINPAYPEMIFSAFEEEGKKRRSLETHIVDSKIKYMFRGRCSVLCLVYLPSVYLLFWQYTVKLL